MASQCYEFIIKYSWECLEIVNVTTAWNYLPMALSVCQYMFTFLTLIIYCWDHTRLTWFNNDHLGLYCWLFWYTVNSDLTDSDHNILRMIIEVYILRMIIEVYNDLTRSYRFTMIYQWTLPINNDLTINDHNILRMIIQVNNTWLYRALFLSLIK